MKNGFYNYRYELHKEGYFKNQLLKDGKELIAYKFDDGNSLYVPGEWNSQRPELLWYEATVWYKYLFDDTLAQAGRSFLCICAVNYEAIVCLNGNKLGIDRGGFTPFLYELRESYWPRTISSW